VCDTDPISTNPNPNHNNNPWTENSLEQIQLSVPGDGIYNLRFVRK